MVVPPAAAKPLPQATIKLQAAPAAAAARKPLESLAVPTAKKLDLAELKGEGKSATVSDEDEDETAENAADDIPLPFAIAAAALALLAVGVQVWMLLIA
jgi:hypothetical protein